MLSWSSAGRVGRCLTVKSCQSGATCVSDRRPFGGGFSEISGVDGGSQEEL